MQTEMKLTAEIGSIFAALPLLICFHSNSAHAIPRSSDASGPCEILLHVEKKPLIIDLTEHAGCSITLTASHDKVLAFRLTEGPLTQLNGRVKIRDGVGLEAGYVRLDNAQEKDRSKIKLMERLKRETVYSTGTSATFEISDELTSSEGNFRLEIRLAVECPFNIGTETQCGRVFDDVSCYCATFTLRNWYDQKFFCQSNGLKLVALESKAEEDAVKAAWGTDTFYWTSLNQIENQGTWVWESTGVRLYPGYANWGTTQPDNPYNGNEQCAHMNYGGERRWNNYPCSTNLLGAICENRP